MHIFAIEIRVRIGLERLREGVIEVIKREIERVFLYIEVEKEVGAMRGS